MRVVVRVPELVRDGVQEEVLKAIQYNIGTIPKINLREENRNFSKYGFWYCMCDSPDPPRPDPWTFVGRYPLAV